MIKAKYFVTIRIPIALINILKIKSTTEFYFLIPVDKFNMSEWKVTDFTIEFTLPLTIDAHFRHLYNVTNLKQ